MMGRRRDRARTSAQLTTIYWRDIPAQVTGRSGSDKVAIELPARFQVAIDRAAAVADKVKYDDYIGEWRSENANFEGDMQAAVDQRAAALEDAFTRERIAALVANGGYEDQSHKDPADE